MGTVKVNSKYNTWISSSSPDDNYETSMGMAISKYDGGLYSYDHKAVMQFAIPELSNQVIDKATLHFFVVRSSMKVILNFAIYNIGQSLEGLTYSQFQKQYADKMIATAGETITFDDSSISYRQWKQIDLTALIMNYRGDEYYTVIVFDTDGESGNNDATIASYNDPGEYTAYLEIEYHDAVPDKPKIIYPYGDIIQKGTEIEFQWQYQSPWDTGQKKFEIGWKMQSESDWNTETVVSQSSRYYLNSGKLSLGILEWRVKTYNELGNASDYAYGTAILQGAATPPIITGVSNNAIPTIYWFASGDDIAKLRIQILDQGTVIYDSGVFPGGLEQQYTPNMIFQPGTYTATIQAGSIFDVWSNPAVYTFSITAPGPEKPVLIAKGMGSFIRLEVTNRKTDIFIYKSEDGKNYYPIARTNKDLYDDYAVKSGVLYWYYVVAYSGGVTYSDQSTAVANYKGTEIFEIGNPEESVNLNLSEDDIYVYADSSLQTEYSLIQYAGREYPVKESGEHMDKQTSWTVFLKNEDEKKLESIFFKNGIYCVKSSRELYFAAISNLNARETLFLKGFSVGIQVTKIDYSERIEINV